jgi:hypothetical protein
MPAPAFRLPKLDQRISIVGHTGSGKTVFAAWVLSHAPLQRMPAIIIDYKYDKLLNSIQKTEEIRMDKKLPSRPGLYITHPVPHEESEVEDFMWKIWEKGNTLVYVDEAHMLPDRGALRALLTQGRSKRIPMIVLTQRPSWTSRFTFSEADHVAAFHLQYPDDKRFISGLLDRDMKKPLPQFHCHYHIVADHSNFVLRPVPDGDTIRARIEARLRPRTWFS